MTLNDYELAVEYDDKPSKPPPKGRTIKSALRLAVEKIPVGYAARFPLHQREELDRVVQRIRQAESGSKLAVRQQHNGVKVWRLS